MRKKLIALFMGCLLMVIMPLAVQASVSTADLKNGSVIKGDVYINVKTSSVYAETNATSTTTYISVSATNCPFNDNSTGHTTCYTTGSGVPQGQSGTVAGTARIGGVTYSGATSATSS